MALQVIHAPSIEYLNGQVISLFSEQIRDAGSLESELREAIDFAFDFTKLWLTDHGFTDFSHQLDALDDVFGEDEASFKVGMRMLGGHLRLIDRYEREGIKDRRIGLEREIEKQNERLSARQKSQTELWLAHKTTDEFDPYKEKMYTILQDRSKANISFQAELSILEDDLRVLNGRHADYSKSRERMKIFEVVKIPYLEIITDDKIKFFLPITEEQVKKGYGFAKRVFDVFAAGTAQGVF